MVHFLSCSHFTPVVPIPFPSLGVGLNMGAGLRLEVHLFPLAGIVQKEFLDLLPGHLGSVRIERVRHEGAFLVVSEPKGGMDDLMENNLSGAYHPLRDPDHATPEGREAEDPRVVLRDPHLDAGERREQGFGFVDEADHLPPESIDLVVHLQVRELVRFGPLAALHSITPFILSFYGHRSRPVPFVGRWIKHMDIMQ